MFDVGQKVVYPNHGVSVVEEISSAAFDEVDRKLYHLRLLSNNSKVMVPEDNLELVGLRPLCGTTEIQSLIEILRNGNIDTYKDWKGRYKQNLDKMKTGQLTEVAEVLKNLCLVSQKKSLSFREKKMFERAKYFIVSEVAHVKELDNDDAEALVEASLETSLEKLRKVAEEKAAAKQAKIDAKEASKLEAEASEKEAKADPDAADSEKGAEAEKAGAGKEAKAEKAKPEKAKAEKAKAEKAKKAPKPKKTAKAGKTDKKAADA